MSLWTRLRGSRPLQDELDEELRSHLAMAARDRLERGESPAEAERNARRELGNQTLLKEVLREVWLWPGFDRLSRDLSYAFRQMRRSPGFTSVAVLTLALGLGATTAMFSIVNAVLLEPLHFRDPGQLYVARSVPPPDSPVKGDFPVNARHAYEWRTHCRFCEAVALAQFQEMTLVGAGEPVKLAGLAVSFNFFRTLGIQPAFGRDFLPEDDAPRQFDKVILSNALWTSHFAADPSIVGRKIQMNGEPYTVIAVMPPDLVLPKGDEWGALFGPADAPLVFRPLGINLSSVMGAGSLNYTALVRLKRGVTASQASAELNALLADFVRQFHFTLRTTLIPLQQQVTRGARSALWLLLASVGAVLLIVCLNVGNLMVVRTAGRYREAGVRLALGASRGQLFSLVLSEALALVALGAVLGLAATYVALKLFVAWAPAGLPRMEEVQLDWRVLIFAGAVTAFSTIACGLLPAWRLASIEVQESLKAGAATSTEAGGKLRGRELLVGLEVALSTVLLMAGGLLLLSFFRLVRVDKGFEVAHIITQDVSYLSPKYARGARRYAVENTLASLERIPGAEVAGGINRLPLRGDDWISELIDPAQPRRSVADSTVANFRFVTPGYFKAMGIPLKLGRLLDTSDRDQPRAVISAGVAQYLWPGQHPLGRHLVGVGPRAPQLEVVGVVGEVRASGLAQNPTMIVYEHYWRMQPIGMSFVVRTRGDPRAAVSAIRSAFSSADPEMGLAPSVTMEQIVDESVASRRFQLNLAGAFALSALLLASLGIYGVISFTVARRTPEIGIRLALGARNRDILTMILGQGMRPVLGGLAVGLACAAGVSRLIANQLFQVKPWNPLAVFGVITLLLLVALAACWIPARRASRVDPLRALRFE